MSDEIKGLINAERWEEVKEMNSHDGYSNACVQVAINVMKYIDTFEGDFNIGYHPDMTTPHGIICACDNQGGITGFMAGAARNMVASFHKDGWKFWLADAISSYDVDNQDRLNNYVNSLMAAELIDVSREEAEAYIEGLIGRYHQKLAERTPEQVAEAEAIEEAVTSAAKEMAENIKEFIERSEEEEQ